jgi:hypothetical protein
MVAEASIALTKLLLGLAVFAVVGYVGKSYDKRIAGVLLTFPILNGIGILTGQDPLAVVNSIYVVVVANGLVLFLMIVWCDRLPRLGAASPNVKLVVRIVVWAAAWAVSAPVVILWRDDLPGPGGLLLIQLAIVAGAAILFWQPKAPGLRENASGPAPPGSRHVRALIAFWSDGAGILRLALFAASFALLLFASYAYDSKWLGMFSALPVPGLFAVATLSVIEEPDYFERMRDTVLLGPVSVIVFNWLYAHIVLYLPLDPPARVGIGIVAMLLLLLADAIFIFWTTPPLTRFFDRVYAARSVNP